MIDQQQVYSFKVRSYKPFTGVALTLGVVWTLLKSIPADYVLDGYRLVRSEAILRAERAGWEVQIETVLRLKGQSAVESSLFPLASDVELFEHFRASQQLVALYLRDDSLLVGVVRKVHRHSVRLQLLNTKGQWLAQHSFAFNRLKIVETETDYLLSLQLLASFREEVVGSKQVKSY